ncbi:aminotransferase-like domain-containing protein [Actinacidiphila rubida]|uniref:(S)-3,5-dihydroxyphenylglycine transaminase n=1 Tax=Actinacidiphila rubida TaxID=310780 RepID=A0A1H8EIS6_9ACTN|nr:PLP-dependent aminotransferase family protein [Actinacidiphila rubida]SEN18767.1 (S)-3,5-dihydroxyphenylglycine transaminase [Actinacidiphila rubida]
MTAPVRPPLPAPEAAPVRPPLPARDAAPERADLDASGLHGSLTDPLLSAMTFLNEVAGRHPEALSLAAGTPYEGFYDVEDVHRALRAYCAHLREERGYDERHVRRALLQYGRTKGIIHDLIARYLSVDEGVDVDPEAIVVTTGCQEALLLTMRALKRDERDVLLAVDPVYVGVTGAARLLDLPVHPVAGGTDGVDLGDLRRRIHRARAAGQRPRACYLVPDFANPTGLRLSLATRLALLDLAEQEDVLLLEDNPYGLFPLEGQRLPTLKALDTNRRVVHLGSLSKSVFPGVRIGFAVADQQVRQGPGDRVLFADLLAKAKSMVTVNTAPLSQAVAGGWLLEHGCSLARATQDVREVYRRNLRQLVDGLAARFPAPSPVTWNTPDGGFFVVVDVPFEVTDATLEYSAARHGVLWTPLHHFYDGRPVLRSLRLSISALEPDDVDDALDRFAGFVHACAGASPGSP